MFKKKNLILLLAFIAIATIFLFLVSMSTSPLYKHWGYDSAIFMLIGKAVASGKLLYVDIFDHKGPIIFFIEAIGMWIGGIKGIFAIQVINLVIILCLLFKIAEIFQLSRKAFWALIVIVLIFLSATFDDGNMTEEYSLPFLFLSLYLSLKYSLSRNNAHPPKYAFIYGACIATLFLVRLTNSAAICGIILAIVILLFIKKEWRNLLHNAIAFILGFVLIFGGVCLYFWLNDALDDMIYATFTFNFLYSKTVAGGIGGNGIKEIIKLLLIFMPFLLSLVMSILYYRKTKNQKLLLIGLIVSIATLVTVNIGMRTFHYITLNLIPLVFGLTLFLKEESGWRKKTRIAGKAYIFVLLLASLAATYNLVYVYKLSRDKDLLYNNFSYTVDVPLVDSLIQRADRDSVFGYNLASNWYLATDILPPFKYYTSQELWSRTDSTIFYETNRYLIQTPPKWIVIPKAHKVDQIQGISGNHTLEELLNAKYILRGEDINHTYYSRKDIYQ